MIIKAHYSAALAVSILISAFSPGVRATTVSITSEIFTGNAPFEDTQQAASYSGSFSQNATGSINDVELSPYYFNTGPGPDGNAAAANAAYSVLGTAGGPVSTATYNVNSGTFTLLWGSPDPYNQIAFYTGANGTGSLIDVIGGNATNYDGSNLACFASSCTDTLFDLVTFAASSGNIGSVILTDTGAAFEYALSAMRDPVAATPVPEPAALPLFAGGLGALGLLGWRRNRKAQSHRLNKHA